MMITYSHCICWPDGSIYFLILISAIITDLDGNGYWDEMEVKALFQKELDKMYDPNASEDDLMERYEEMERMREHVFRESDTNKDNLLR